MDSPTSSEVLLFSEDDSGLLVNGSFSNSSVSASSYEQSSRCKESDESLSLSLEDSLINDSDTLYTPQFNTLKKCPDVKQLEVQIQPPAEFQDLPPSFLNVYSPPLEFKDNKCQHICSPVYTNNYMICVEQYANDFVKLLIGDSLKHLDSFNNTRQLKQHKLYPNLGIYWKTNHRLPIGSNNSLLSSISSSHNSLFNVVSSDDSNFISSAVSHDALNSDTYTLPINSSPFNVAFRRPLRKKRKFRNECHSVPFNKKPIEKCRSVQEPTHMTVNEVRTVLHNIYSNTEECNKLQVANVSRCSSTIHNDHDKENYVNKVLTSKCKIRKHSLMVNIKHKKVKDNCASEDNGGHSSSHSSRKIFCASPFISSAKSNFSFSLKQTFCNIFRSRKSTSTDSDPGLNPQDTVVLLDVTKETTFEKRALPPVPNNNGSCGHTYQRETSTDFATSIEKVKDYGWYWGPISGEAAEKILSNEPDGSFIVRDSSDDHYIFSLTFKLNGFVRHVRIEHDQGNFSFGSCTKFKSHTIVEFVENAVEHSRSGRYLFFLHRRPVLGPMRVQLLHPVSRFKQIQSLQHMCRFVILKMVRRDLIHKLPLPRRLTDYLNSPHYYCEQLGSTDSSSSSTPTPAVHLISFTPP